MLGEGVVKQRAMATHGAAVGMMNSDADAAAMAAHYLSVAGGGGRGMGSGGGTTHEHHYDIKALDGKSFGKYLDAGGMEQINLAANRRVAQYAGDGNG